MPDVEVDPRAAAPPRVREHPQALDRAEREQRPQHRPVQAREQAERGEVADQDVLDHVKAEELLLADRGDRGGERDEQEHEPEREERDAPAGRGVPRRRSVRSRTA